MLLWCDGKQDEAEMDRLAQHFRHRKVLYFSTPVKFTRWLFQQRRGEVSPWAVLVAGWREAKPCLLAIRAARSGDSNSLRPDARRPQLRTAAGFMPRHRSEDGGLSIAVGKMVVLMEKPQQESRIEAWIRAEMANIFVFTIELAREGSEVLRYSRPLEDGRRASDGLHHDGYKVQHLPRELGLLQPGVCGGVAHVSGHRGPYPDGASHGGPFMPLDAGAGQCGMCMVGRIPLDAGAGHGGMCIGGHRGGPSHGGETTWYGAGPHGCGDGNFDVGATLTWPPSHGGAGRGFDRGGGGSGGGGGGGCSLAPHGLQFFVGGAPSMASHMGDGLQHFAAAGFGPGAQYLGSISSPYHAAGGSPMASCSGYGTAGFVPSQVARQVSNPAWARMRTASPVYTYRGVAVSSSSHSSSSHTQPLARAPPCDTKAGTDGRRGGTGRVAGRRDSHPRLQRSQQAEAAAHAEQINLAVDGEHVLPDVEVDGLEAAANAVIYQ